MTASLLHTVRKPVETVEEFEQWLVMQPHLSDKRFEFVDGQVIEKPGMKQEEAFIAYFLQSKFLQTNAAKNGDALLPELDSYVNQSRKRIPDLTYLSAQQMREAKSGKRFATAFAIEILSDSEELNHIENKIADYFSAGAQLVWYISPNKQRIYAYTTPDEVKIYKGTDVCTANPVLPDFSFRVEEMFA